jgi:F-type H+-transporting ATPase subunit alpha
LAPTPSGSTDDQIYLETDLFNANIRPAINVGLSVSRVGGSAQIKAMRQVAGSLRLELAPYRSLEAFAQFGSDLDKASRNQLNRGKRWVEVLKQRPYSPIPVEKQVAILFACGNGFLDDIAIEDIHRFELELYQFLENGKPEVLQAIREKKELTGEIKNQLKAAVKEFKEERFKKSAPEAKATPGPQNNTHGSAARAEQETKTPVKA